MVKFLKQYFSFLFPLPLRVRVLAGIIFDRNIYHGYKGRQQFFYKAFKALTFNEIDGDYVEFGCHGGMTFKLAYQESRRHGHNANLWGFDSFAGLPDTNETKDEHPFWKPGTLATSIEEFHSICMRNGVPRNSYQVIKGYYEKSLPELTEGNTPKDICLAYIDCDLYSSTKSVFDFLRPRLKHGMIIAFDDYFCWSATRISGERKAMLEEFSNNKDWSLLPYISFGWHGMSFVIEDRRLIQV